MLLASGSSCRLPHQQTQLAYPRVRRLEFGAHHIGGATPAIIEKHVSMISSAWRGACRCSTGSQGGDAHAACTPCRMHPMPHAPHAACTPCRMHPMPHAPHAACTPCRMHPMPHAVQAQGGKGMLCSGLRAGGHAVQGPWGHAVQG